MDEPQQTQRELYRVVNVEQAAAPEGMTGTWHRYTIQRGKSIIEGMQRGGLGKVTEHAEQYVETLNERITKTTYAYGTRGKK